MSGDRQKMGAYARPPADYSTFDAREAENERRGPILLIAFVVVASLFGAVVWNAYHLGVRDRNDPPVIETAGDYRQAPDDPGGYQTPGQDIDVYGLTSPEESGETAEAEQVTNTGTDTPEQSGTDSAPVNETRSEPEPAEVEDDTTATETMTDLVESVTDQPARQAEDGADDTVEADDELIMPGPDTTQVDASQPEPVTEPETQTVTRPASTEGNFVVQIRKFLAKIFQPAFCVCLVS